MEDNEPQTTLRDTLESNFAAAEPVKTDVEPVETVKTEPVKTESVKSDRNEKGQFQKAEQNNEVVQEPEKPQSMRPTTWKKQYLPIWDKLEKGEPLLPDEAKKLAEYSAQREKEYASGVSTYRAEAQNAKELQGAMEPFLPILQQHNIKPTEWISNLGKAHQTLALGSPEQKLQMFAKLAQDYGVPLGAIGNQNTDPVVPQLMQYIQNLESKVNNVASWRDTQEQQMIQREIAKFNDAEKFPHFEAVRPLMAQLLESGLAHDLDTAYKKAIRMDEDVWQEEMERQTLQSQQIQKTEAAKQAKSKAVSTRTSTPTGTVSSGTTDRRALLESAMNQAGGGRV